MPIFEGRGAHEGERTARSARISEKERNTALKGEGKKGGREIEKEGEREEVSATHRLSFCLVLGGCRCVNRAHQETHAPRIVRALSSEGAPFCPRADKGLSRTAVSLASKLNFLFNQQESGHHTRCHIPCPSPFFCERVRAPPHSFPRRPSGTHKRSLRRADKRMKECASTRERVS